MEIPLKYKYRQPKPMGRNHSSFSGNSGKARHKGSAKPGIPAPRPPGDHARGVRTLVISASGKRAWR